MREMTVGRLSNATGTQMPDFFTVTANLPGVVEEDICLCTVGDVLSLSVDNQDKQENKEEVQTHCPENE